MKESHVNKIVDNLFRHDAGRLVSVLTRIFGTENLDLAEDVVQDSLVEAMNQWTYKGIPENPSGWLFTVNTPGHQRLVKSMGSVDVSTEIIINRPVEAVATFAADPDNATKWYVNIKSVTWKTPKPLMIGSQLEFSAAFLGKKLDYTYEIIDLSPNRKLVMRTAEGPFPMETTYMWERISDNETRMVLRNRGTPSGFARFFAPVMEFAMKNANRKDLKRLKYLLEKS